MTLVEIIPYDYVPFQENLYEKKIFKFNFDMDFPMLLTISYNLERPDMVHLKKSISKLLYGNPTNFWASILEEKYSITQDYEESTLLEDIFMKASVKNDY